MSKVKKKERKTSNPEFDDGFCSCLIKNSWTIKMS